MPTSLSKIKSQIEKLQKQAAAIESGIVVRIKAEIAKHGLTAEQLFGSSSTARVGGRGSAAAKPKSTAKAGASKPAKFADGTGNTWGGMGKRPQWIHDALEAGKSLDAFLVSDKKLAAAEVEPVVKAAPAKKAKVTSKAAPKKRTAAAKKVAPVKAAGSRVAAKRTAKAAATKGSAKQSASA